MRSYVITSDGLSLLNTISCDVSVTNDNFDELVLPDTQQENHILCLIISTNTKIQFGVNVVISNVL